MWTTFWMHILIFFHERTRRWSAVARSCRAPTGAYQSFEDFALGELPYLITLPYCNNPQNTDVYMLLIVIGIFLYIKNVHT